MISDIAASRALSAVFPIWSAKASLIRRGRPLKSILTLRAENPSVVSRASLKIGPRRERLGCLVGGLHRKYPLSSSHESERLQSSIRWLLDFWPRASMIFLGSKVTGSGCSPSSEASANAAYSLNRPRLSMDPDISVPLKGGGRCHRPRFEAAYQWQAAADVAMGSHGYTLKRHLGETSTASSLGSRLPRNAQVPGSNAPRADIRASCQLELAGKNSLGTDRAPLRAAACTKIACLRRAHTITARSARDCTNKDCAGSRRTRRLRARVESQRAPTRPVAKTRRDKRGECHRPGDQ